MLHKCIDLPAELVSTLRGLGRRFVRQIGRGSVKHFIAAFILLISATAALAQDGSVRVVVGYNGPVDESVFAAHGGSSIKTLKIGSAAVGMLPVGKLEKVRALAAVAYVNV